LITEDEHMTFSPDYTTARKRFREAAERLGWALEAYPIGAVGPQGEDLTVDMACSTLAESDRVLVLSSGLHGVEGFLGSAVQLALLERWKWKSASAPGVRCVLLHALNPFGFAWSRRFDAESIDPNRNFLLEEEEYSGSSSTYASFDALLNPRRVPSFWDLFYLKALWAIVRHGRTALKQALVTGQYDFPKGLFFGGKKPCRTKEIVQQHLKSWLGNAKTIAHLDFHTGLGRWGRCKLLIDYRPTAAQEERLIRWFGTDAYEENDPQKLAYQTRGSFGRWCAAKDWGATYVFVFAEFGTYSNLSMISGLRTENQAHHWGKATDHGTTRAKARLRDLFCPPSQAWRTRVLTTSMDLVGKAVAGLLQE
jgi:hypothetical protein